MRIPTHCLSRPRSVLICRSLIAALAAALLLLAAACSDEHSTAPALEPSFSAQGNVLTVTIVDPPTTLAPGASAQLEAEVTNPQGRTVNAKVKWSSSDAGVATVTEGGLLTAISAGAATLEASVGNFGASFALTVGASDPDLLLAALTLSATEVPLGQPLVVSATVENPTTADAGAAELRLDVLSDSDDVVHTVTLVQPALPGGATVVLDATLTADATWPASVRIRGHADAGEIITEQDEANNVVESEPVTILAPDLVVSALSASAPSVVLGCDVAVSATVRNAGNGPAPATTSALLLLGDGGVELARLGVAHGALAPGEEATLAASWPADAAWPTSVDPVAHADVPDAVLERDEANNSRATEAVRAVVAPPEGYTKLWICGGGPNWHGPANWLPAGVPVASDDVYVPAGTPHAPAIGAPVQLDALTVEDGARVVLNQVLSATGDVMGGEIAGTGRLEMRGAPARLRGTVPLMHVHGDVILNGDVLGLGDTHIVPAGRLTLAGNRFETGSLVSAIRTHASDGLRMTHPDDELVTRGWVVLQQASNTASSDGSFSAGTIRVLGQQFVSNGIETFYSTGTRLVMAGASPQITTIVGSSRVQDVLIDNPAGVTMGTTAVHGRLTLAPGAVLENGHSAALFFHTHLPVTGPGYRFVDNRVQGDIVMDGDADFPNHTNLWIRPGGRLTVNGHRLSVSGAFTVNMNDGRADGLIMNAATDRVALAKRALFNADVAGVDTEGSFTAGELRVGGAFTAQGGSPKAFVATGTTVVLDGQAAQEIAIVPRQGLDGSRFQDLVIENDGDGAFLGGGFPAGGASGITVTGQLAVVGNGKLGNPQGHGLRLTGALPITGPGYTVSENQVHGRIVMDRDAAIPNGGRLRIHPGGQVVLNGHGLAVDGLLEAHVVNGAEEGLVMTNPADELIVNGDLVYQGGGGTSVGNLTAGTMRLRGRFAQRLTHAGHRRDVFVTTGTVVVFEGDGAEQDAAWHSPWDGGSTPGSFFQDLVVAPGALLVQRTYGSMYVPGTADIAGRLENRWGATWIAARDLALRSTAAVLVDSGAVCYGTLTQETGATVTLQPPGGSAYFGVMGGDPRGACAP